MRLPGLVDVHVHMREPGGTHKEDWDSGTAAALAGGVTLVLGMPNTRPAVTDSQTLDEALAAAASKARCDYGQYLGAGPVVPDVTGLAERIAGVKMYLDQTYGPLRLDEMDLWVRHFSAWPVQVPVAVHAEGRSLAAAILLASLSDRPVHLCHVSTREEIEVIRMAKERGVKVTCEVAPHHLFLCEEDAAAIGAGRSEVRPRLARRRDVEALWQNLDVIDCFATDHAPHTLAEKDGENPPPGFPGLETALPLFLNAVTEGRLSLEDIIQRYVTAPRRIYHLPEQPETWVEVDLDSAWEVRAAEMHSRCGWTPFEGWKLRGRVRSVTLRGQEVMRDGQVLAKVGSGRNVRL